MIINGSGGIFPSLPVFNAFSLPAGWVYYGVIDDVKAKQRQVLCLPAAVRELFCLARRHLVAFAWIVNPSLESKEASMNW